MNRVSINMTSLSTDTLAELVERRHDCLRELLALTEQQYRQANGGDIDGLLATLDRKQPYLTTLARLSTAIKAFERQDAQGRAWSEPAQRSLYQRLWKESSDLHARIVDLERQSETILQDRRTQLGQRLQLSHSTQEIHRAYLCGRQPAAAEAGNQLDLMEE